jgi:hypothetical protein
MYKSILTRGEFCYATAITTLTTGQTLVPAINISNDSDFEVHEVRAQIMLPATGIDAVTSSVTMLASLANGELFSNVAINLLAFASQAFVLAANNSQNLSGYPIRLPVGMVIPANSQINHTLTNNTNGTVTVQIQYWGCKIPRSMN